MKKKHYSPKLLIFLTVFIDLLGFGIIIPILPVISAHYPLGTLGPGVRVAILMSAFSLLQMLFSPFWGRLSDRHGRRPILLLSLAGSTASYLMLAFADSYAMLLVSRLLAGVCSANITAAQAYIADITPEKERTGGMGLIGMAFGLGFAFGPVIGGGATYLWGVWHPGSAAHMGPGLVAGAICGVNLIWAIFKLPESLPPRHRDRVSFRRFATMRETMANLRHPAIAPLIVLFFVVTFAFANLEVSFVLYARHVMGVTPKELASSFALFLEAKSGNYPGDFEFYSSYLDTQGALTLHKTASISQESPKSYLFTKDPPAKSSKLESAFLQKIYLFFIWLGIVLAVVQGVIVRRLVKWISEPVLIMLGLAILALGLFMTPMGTSLPYLMGAMTLLATGQGLSNPCILSLISRSASARAQGNVMGTSQAAASLARILGPMFGGWLFDYGARCPFWTAAALMTLAVAWAEFTRRRLSAFPPHAEQLEPGEARQAEI